MDNAPTLLQTEIHHTTLNANLNQGKGSGTPHCSSPPVTKQHLSDTHTHRASTEFYLSVTQASSLPADAVSGCHYVLTGYLRWGHRLSTAETVSKCPTLIQGLWKEPTSWINSMEGQRVERPAWCSTTVSAFRSVGVGPPDTDTGSGCTHQCTFTTDLSYHFYSIL